MCAHSRWQSVYNFLFVSIHSHWSSKLGEDEAQPEVVVRVVGRVVVPVRGAAVPGRVVPAASAVHAVRSTHRLSPADFKTRFSEFFAFCVKCEREEWKNVFRVVLFTPFFIVEKSLIGQEFMSKTSFASSGESVMVRQNPIPQENLTLFFFSEYRRFQSQF